MDGWNWTKISGVTRLLLRNIWVGSRYGRDISRGIISQQKSSWVEIEIGEASSTFWKIEIEIGEASPIDRIISRQKSSRVEIEIGEASSTFWKIEIKIGEASPIDLAHIWWVVDLPSPWPASRAFPWNLSPPWFLVLLGHVISFWKAFHKANKIVRAKFWFRA